MDSYIKYIEILKALSDRNRLNIVDMLSCGELCACMILEKFHFTQPTLSHHMKTLCDCGLVNGRKEGRWIYYSLDENTVPEFMAFLTEITSFKENYICLEELCCERDCE